MITSLVNVIATFVAMYVVDKFSRKVLFYQGGYCCNLLAKNLEHLATVIIYPSVMTVFVYYLLPETKGIPIEDMAMVWKSHAFWKRFVNDDVDNEKPKKCPP
ncbi:hypothetical protein AgCh_002581 [Apium graveolens]